MAILATWHPINGEWVHIIQEERGNSIAYFTNGELVAEEFITDIPYVFEPVKKPNKNLKHRRDEVHSE